MRRRSTTSGAGAEPPIATRAAHPECARRPRTAGRREVCVGPSLAAGWPIIGLLPASSELAAEVAVEPGARFAPDRVRAVTFALVLVTALASLESTVVSTAMPTIIGELRGLAVYSWVFSAYLLSATVTMPIYGRLADLYGRRRILLIAISLFVVGAGACAAAQTMSHLIAARVLQVGRGRADAGRPHRLRRSLLAARARAHPGPVQRHLGR